MYTYIHDLFVCKYACMYSVLAHLRTHIPSLTHCCFVHLYIVLLYFYSKSLFVYPCMNKYKHTFRYIYTYMYVCVVFFCKSLFSLRIFKVMWCLVPLHVHMYVIREAELWMRCAMALLHFCVNALLYMARLYTYASMNHARYEEVSDSHTYIYFKTR